MKTNSPVNRPHKAILVLEDGSFFLGSGFGAVKKISGEVVFSTSMVGYTEALTDPSYNRQILTLTYPLVGNYGVPQINSGDGLPLHFESESLKISGLVIYELCNTPFHWASVMTLDEWLAIEDVPGICEIDTRALTKRLRSEGVMQGILQTFENDQSINLDTILSEVKTLSDPNLRNLVSEVTVKEPVHYPSYSDKTVVLIDCGVKYGILRNLIDLGINVIRVPYDFSAQEVLAYHPDGVVLSNGPGDPKKCSDTITSVQRLVDKGLPIMGICLGNLILALALGGETYKMKYGHRSQNQPVLNTETGLCYITTQNHGYSIIPESLKHTDLEILFVNANDKTTEGIKHKSKPVFAVQWHPEASPGPYDTKFLFADFLKRLEV